MLIGRVGERFYQSPGCIDDDILKTQQLPHPSNCPRIASFQTSDCLSIWSVSCCRNNLNQLLDFLPEESTFLWLKLHTMSTKTSEYLSDVINMVLKCIAKDDDIINVSYAYVIPKTILAVFHETLKFSRCIL